VKRALLLPVLLLTLWSLQARVIFVKAGGNGDGSSWSNAFGDLQPALKTAQAGDQIWVAAGKYLPTKNADRNIAFNIPSGVELWGGFAGHESQLEERDWRINLTILSGEIGSHSIDDNSYTVVYTKNVSASTIIDGFVITGGAANGTGAKGDISRCGAGWYNNGANGESNPVIANCTFTNNYGRDGAALYNFAQNGTTNPTIQNCTFTYNRADLDGGAIYNNGDNGICSPTIESCIFEQNEATYGAGILNLANHGEAKPLIVNCEFVKNISYIRGGSIHNHKGDNSSNEPIVQNCRFADNVSTVGKESNSSVNLETSSATKQK
jgi:predicted outer membrane repeat protein